MTLRARLRPFDALAAAAAILLAAVATPVLAQYKVIGADGKITYTDRAPSEGRVTALGARSSSLSESDLPLELRQAVSRYPVTLYAVAAACEACSAARQFLKQRGIPFNERQVVTAEDVDALEKLSGGREAPTLTINTQVMRGFAADVWTSYLDAAGYPRESKLPSSYAYSPATPIVDRRPQAGAADASRTAAPPPATTAGPTPGTIRF